MDPFAVEVSNGEVAIAVFAVGDALGDALVRPGPVVMRLGSRPVRCADAPHRESACGRGALGAGADEPLADRVHAWRLDGGVQDPGADGLEDGVER